MEIKNKKTKKLKCILIGIIIILLSFGVFGMTYNISVVSSASNTSINFTTLPIEVINLDIEDNYLYLYGINYTNGELSVTMEDYNHSVANNSIGSLDFPSIVPSSFSDNLLSIKSNLNYTINATLEFNLIGYPDEIIYTTPNGLYNKIYGTTDFDFISATNTVTIFVNGIESNTNLNSFIFNYPDTGGSSGGGGGSSSDDTTIDTTTDINDTTNVTDDDTDVDDIITTTPLIECDFSVLPQIVYIYDNHTYQEVTISNNENIELELSYKLKYINGDEFLHTTLGISGEPKKLQPSIGSKFNLYINDFFVTSGKTESQLIITAKQCNNNITIPINVNINDKGNVAIETTKSIAQNDLIVSTESFIKRLSSISFRENVPEDQSKFYNIINFLITTVLGITIILSLITSILVLPEDNNSDYYESSSFGERMVLWIVLTIVYFLVLWGIQWGLGVI